jgi:hypothetical protein
LKQEDGINLKSIQWRVILISLIMHSVRIFCVSLLSVLPTVFPDSCSEIKKSKVSFNIIMGDSQYPIDIEFVTHSKVSYSHLRPSVLELDTTLLCNEPYTIVFSNADYRTEKVYFHNENCRDTIIGVQMHELELIRH